MFLFVCSNQRGKDLQSISLRRSRLGAHQTLDFDQGPVVVGPCTNRFSRHRHTHAARAATIRRRSAAGRSLVATLRSYQLCKFIQNSGLLPKNKASRTAVSALIRRRLLTISAIRLGETPIAWASSFCDNPYSARNSCLSISPGVTGAYWPFVMSCPQ